MYKLRNPRPRKRKKTYLAHKMHLRSLSAPRKSICRVTYKLMDKLLSYWWSILTLQESVATWVKNFQILCKTAPSIWKIGRRFLIILFSRWRSLCPSNNPNWQKLLSPMRIKSKSRTPNLKNKMLKRAKMKLFKNTSNKLTSLMPSICLLFKSQ